ncbi:MAG: 16S rRNA (cytidine(1402)-2'-O)-methyltransferase [Dehalococcoidia bacterium]|nr:16S rRNA (cytidine(1402)-2'-O)-methyltransferase [Dehalococcoidia bacterium]MQG16447.1 16S rRNA (cytidine(1402)-2'-O)-methyltransferase [SAR202 cluster bacterium]|tara:strand:- start:12677 stop:13498 length:822 start_codon:yes stop_codon:yes gene_type:complete
MGSLYVIATPIGNLDDISIRAVNVLKSVQLIAAEDTRITRRLLSHYKIDTKLISYHEHSKLSKSLKLIDLLRNNDLALVCDSGTPGISDPGRELVRMSREEGVDVIPVPGPSSVLAGISVSGLNTDRFMFVGFLPRKSSERIKLFKKTLPEHTALVFLESPRRLHASLIDLKNSLGDRKLTVCREMTKIYEEIFVGNADTALAHFKDPRGEFTVIVDGGIEDRPSKLIEDNARKMLLQLAAMGVSGRDSVEFVVTQTGMAKRKVYQMWQDDTM